MSLSRMVVAGRADLAESRLPERLQIGDWPSLAGDSSNGSGGEVDSANARAVDS